MLIIREKIRKDMLQNIEEITYFDEMFMTKAVADPQTREKIEEVVNKWIEL